MSEPAMTREAVREQVGASPNRALPQFTDYGGYTIDYLTASGESLCAACATLQVDYDPLPNSAYDDPIVAVGTYDEGPTMACAECGKAIESSYGDPDDEQA